MVTFLSCRSGEACLPPVKQTVKRLPWISISCFENTVGESSGILFGFSLTFGETVPAYCKSSSWMKAEVFENDNPAHFAPLHTAHPSSCSVTFSTLMLLTAPLILPSFCTYTKPLQYSSVFHHVGLPCSHIVLAHDACIPRSLQHCAWRHGVSRNVPRCGTVTLVMTSGRGLTISAPVCSLMMPKPLS